MRGVVVADRHVDAAKRRVRRTADHLGRDGRVRLRHRERDLVACSRLCVADQLSVGRCGRLRDGRARGFGRRLREVVIQGEDEAVAQHAVQQQQQELRDDRELQRRDAALILEAATHVMPEAFQCL